MQCLRCGALCLIGDNCPACRTAPSEPPTFVSPTAPRQADGTPVTRQPNVQADASDEQKMQALRASQEIAKRALRGRMSGGPQHDPRFPLPGEIKGEES
ncbi:MAG: hypothetical protein GY716_15935 [bacterium]|nr:hypothetical protein [bacterium]